MKQKPMAKIDTKKKPLTKIDFIYLKSFKLKYFFPSMFFLFTIVTILNLWIQILPFNLLILGWFLYLLILIVSAFDMKKFEKWNVVILALVYAPLTHFYYGLQFIRGYLRTGSLTSTLR